MARVAVLRTPAESIAFERAGRALLLASFLSATAFSFVFPLLPLYVRELSGPDAISTVLWAGLAMAATPMAGAMVSPFWGRLADRVGYRPMLLRALVSAAAIIGLMGLPNAAWQLVLLRALAGAMGSFQPMAMAALTSWSRPEELSTAVSRLQLAAILGTMAGPLVGGGFAAFFGIRLACGVASAILALGTVVVARRLHAPVQRRAKLVSDPRPFRPTLLWLPMLTLVTAQFTDASFNPILPLMLLEGGADAGVVAGLSGLAASLSAGAAAGGAALAGRGFRRSVRYRPVLAAGASLALLSLAATAAPVPWGLVAARIACGGIVVGVTVAAYSAGGLAVPPGQRGSAYGWLSSSSMGGYATSLVAAGALAAIDLRAVLFVDAILCVGAAAGWAWSRGIAPYSATPAPAEGSGESAH